MGNAKAHCTLRRCRWILVMAGLVPAIHAVPFGIFFKSLRYGAAWRAVSSTAMTIYGAGEVAIRRSIGSQAKAVCGTDTPATEVCACATALPPRRS